MENARFMREKIQRGQTCFGTCITFSDATVTEALCGTLDFVWIDAEHNPHSLEGVQAHCMATKGSQTTPLVRVPWNDPALIKPVLDLGAAGVIVPMIKTADDARRAVAACRYPPEGIRGWGPRRPSNYARYSSAAEFAKLANETIITIIQIEQIEAVQNLDEILAVPGITSILIGSNDLSASMGHTGQPRHPEVLAAIDTVIEKTRRTSVWIGIAIGADVELLRGWMDKGVQWLSAGNDYSLMLKATHQVVDALHTR